MRKTVAFWFFGPETAEGDEIEAMLSSLIKQTMPPGYQIPGFFRETVQEHKRLNSFPSVTELANTLRRHIEETDRDFYIVIDGLDHCGPLPPTPRRELLLQILHTLATSTPGNLHLFLSGRNEDDLVRSMAIMELPLVNVDLDETPSPDLAQFVSYRLKQSIDEHNLTHALRESILVRVGEIQ